MQFILRKIFKYLEYYLWILPALILIFLFLIKPSIETIYISFQEKVRVSENEIFDTVRKIFNIKENQIDKKVKEFSGWEQRFLLVIRDLELNPDNINFIENFTVKELSEFIYLKSVEKLKKRKTNFVGFKNYIELLKSKQMRIALNNNLLWLFLFTSITVLLGLFIAYFIERVKWEAIAKTIIFMPMAISFVASAVIWGLMYEKDPAIGNINAFIKFTGIFSIFGLKTFDGIAFLGNSFLVNWAIIAAGVWMWVGYCMVIFIAALRSVPREIIEAAQIDGADTWQIFIFVEIPTIRGTITVVVTVMMITALKVFDIVYTLTGGGPFGSSEVIANLMYRTAFVDMNFEYASAMAVILFIAIIPIMIFNLKSFISEERIRE